MSDGDAAAAAMAAEASGGDAPDAGDVMEADAADGGGRPGIVEILLHTEPDESPDDYDDLPDYTAHGIIGLKKVAHALGVEGLSGGTPAAVNFAQAAVGYADEFSDEGDGDTAGMEVAE